MVPGNPDPRRFKVIAVAEHGDYIIAKIHYPDARNYEGMKVLAYKGIKGEDLRTAAFLDPHFCESHAHVSPIARFAPTDEGWDMAFSFIRSLS